MSLRRTLERAATAYDRLLPPPQGLVVLIYHRVGAGTSSMVDVPMDAFDRQLAHLAGRGDVLSLDEAVASLASGGAPRGVVITFDDGTRDFCEQAVPALERYGLPAVLYAATGPVDAGTTMPWGTPAATWAGLRSAIGTGLVTIGSHTRDHTLLDAVDAATAAEQLRASIDSITEHIGTPPLHFAYPKAVLGNPAAEIEVRTRFRSAALAGSRVNTAGCDLHRLARTPVLRTDTIDSFIAKAQGAMRLEGAARELVTRVRRIGAR